MSQQRRTLDLTGHRFGMLVAVRYVGHQGANRMWECLCDCGNLHAVSVGNLRNKITKSCGCRLREWQKKASQLARVTHRMTDHPLYPTWRNMMSRCYRKQDKGYRHYGARGIRVCKAWHDIKQFVADMGERPKGMSIERRDNNGDYCPENCCWATPKVQNHNRRNTRLVTFRGITLPLSELCEEFKADYKLVHARIGRYGWDLEKALTTPPTTNGSYFRGDPERRKLEGKVIEVHAMGLSYREVGLSLNISRNVVRRIVVKSKR
jgi:hypothetical protein